VKLVSRIAIATFVYLSLLPVAVFAQSSSPQITGISPTSGPEGSRVEITGKNLEDPSAVLFGTIRAAFKSVSAQELVVLVPHKVSTSTITVVTPRGRAITPFPFVISNDPRVPTEVGYKTGYVNPVPPPADFHSALLWGIAIADTRVAGYESAQVEIAWTQLSCRAGGQDVVLNDDTGKVRGGLYRRQPWFGTDVHEPMPMAHANIVWDGVSDPVLPRNGSGRSDHGVIIPVGQDPDRVWHFWSASPRAALPSGNLEGCTVKARVKISAGALLQMGMDYWRSPTVPYGPGGNNHEAGASNWYFPSPEWQEASFTDIGGPQF
jgi:IPT/TIG domain